MVTLEQRQFLKKLSIYLLHDLAITLLVIYQRDKFHTQCNFTASLLAIVLNQKQPTCPSTGQWIYKLWYIYTREYYTAIIKNQLLTHATAAQPKCTIPFIQNSRKCKLIYSNRKSISGWKMVGVGEECAERQEGGITNGHKETFGPDRYIHYLNCSDGLIGFYICQNLSDCTL